MESDHKSRKKIIRNSWNKQLNKIQIISKLFKAQSGLRPSKTSPLHPFCKVLTAVWSLHLLKLYLNSINPTSYGISDSVAAMGHIEVTCQNLDHNLKNWVSYANFHLSTKGRNLVIYTSFNINISFNFRDISLNFDMWPLYVP